MTVSEPGEYILVDPGGMVLGFVRAPDGGLAHVFYGRQDSVGGIRLMEKLGVDSRSFSPVAEPVAGEPEPIAG